MPTSIDGTMGALSSNRRILNTYRAGVTTQASWSTGIANYTTLAIPDATVALTPASTASRFYVVLNCQITRNSTAAHALGTLYLELLRGSTTIGVDRMDYSFGSNVITMTSSSMKISGWDLPTTTSPVTYSARVSGDCSYADFTYSLTNGFRPGPRDITIFEFAS